MNLKSTSAAVFATALAVQTAIPAASGAELHLTASDNASSYGNTSFNIWNKAGGGTEAPNSANDYVVDGGYSMRFPNGSYPSGGWVWPGNSLRIGTVGGSQGVLVVTRNYDSIHTFNIDGLILANGRIQPWVGNYTQTFTGKITVTAPESAPFGVMLSDTSSHPNQTFTIGGTLIGEAGTALRVYANTANYPAKFNLPTTPAAFHGTIIVGNGEPSKSITCSTDYNKEMPGGFRITTGSTLTSLNNGKNWKVGFLELQSGASFIPPDSGTRWTVGSLALDVESMLNMRINGSAISTIAITNALSVAPGAILNFNGAPTAGDTNAMEWVVLTLPQDKGAIPLGNFTLSGLASFPGELPRYSLATNAVDGKWRLLLKKRAHDYLAVNDDSGWDITQALPSALTTASSWANGEVPRAGVDYAAENGKGGLTAYPIVRTPYQREPFVFAGDSLTLASGSRLMLCGSDTTFPILALGANTLIPLAMAGSPSHFRGKIHTFGGSDTYPQRLQAYFNVLNTVEAEVSGGGTIHVLSRQSSSRPYGDMEFTGLNTNFTGKIRVCAESTDDANTIPTAENLRHERLFVTDARNLGGPLNAFRADALELADYSVLEARNDVDFNVANRGVKVSGNAGFAAPENVTLAISNDITWNGTARKTGVGTLALGGAPRIDAGATAVLSVEQGLLKVRSTYAVNGVSVSFEDGAYLLVDPAATGDIAAYGAVDLSAHPFGGALPVAFDYPGGAPEGEPTATIAVATVADAAKAQSLDLSARKMRGYSVKFPTRANSDGTVTILAKCFKPAFIMVVR